MEFCANDFQEIDTLYNIMIINMSYVEIEKFKFGKYLRYAQVLKEHSEFRILSNNEMHGFFKFIANFYQSEYI